MCGFEIKSRIRQDVVIYGRLPDDLSIFVVCIKLQAVHIIMKQSTSRLIIIK